MEEVTECVTYTREIITEKNHKKFQMNEKLFPKNAQNSI